MAFSRGQQGKYRPLVAKAWSEHAAGHGLDPKDKPAQRAWYEKILKTEFNVTSSKDLRPGDHFEKAMAYFEALVGEDYYWQMKAEGGNVNRIMHAVGDAWTTEAHAQGIADQAFRRTVNLSDLTPDQCIVVIRALKIEAARNSDSSCVPSENPF